MLLVITKQTTVGHMTDVTVIFSDWVAELAEVHLSTTSPRRSRATIDSSVSRRWLCVAGCRIMWSRKIIRPKLYTLSTLFCCT